MIFDPLCPERVCGFTPAVLKNFGLVVIYLRISLLTYRVELNEWKAQSESMNKLCIGPTYMECSKVQSADVEISSKINAEAWPTMVHTGRAINT